MTDAKKKKKTIIIVLLAVVLVIAIVAMALCIPRNGEKRQEIWSATDEFSVDSVKSIEAGDKQFKILMFTDLQLWTDIADNNETFKMMDVLVEETKPDLIIMPGDNVSGLTTDMLTKQLVKKMESYQIPWACTFGNHDAEGNATLSWQADRYEEAEYSLFSRGPSNLYGMGNYAINITRNGKIDKTLFLLDNGRYYDYESGADEIWMSYEQIAWYEWTVKGIAEANGEKTVPSLVFSHFPQPEMKEAIESFATKGEDGFYYVPDELGFGYCAYLPSVSPVNSGFVDVARENGTTHFFCGHDHENNASIIYEGITYTYGLKTGPSPKYWNDAKIYGGTVITLDKSGAVFIDNIII